jgi:hypothetical protein
MIPIKSKSRKNEHFLLNGIEIPGIQDFQLDYNVNASPLYYLGNSKVNTAPRGQRVGNVSLNSLLISDDYFIGLTGVSGCNGYTLENRPVKNGDGVRQEVRKFYHVQLEGFISGYLTSYTQSCGLGEIPKIQSNFTVYKNIGLLDSKQDKEVETDWRNTINDPLTKQFSAPNSYNTEINLLGGNFETSFDRFIYYSFTVDVEREPVFVPGYKYPVDIIQKRPINVTFEMQFEIDRYKMFNIENYPEKQIFSDIELLLNDFETNAAFKTYRFNNLHLINQSRSATINNNSLINLTYQGFYL